MDGIREILMAMAIDLEGAIPGSIPGRGEGADEATLNNILNVVFWGLGVVGVIIIIYGGIQFMISQGDAGKAQKGRMTIIYAVIGIVVVLVAAAITNFVLGATGA